MDLIIPDQYYQIVYDYKQVYEFAKRFLPSKSTQVMNLTLFARRKYDSNIPKATIKLKQMFLCGCERDDSNTIFRDQKCQKLVIELYRLHCPIGSFNINSTEVISNDALVVYAHLIPKNPIKALNKTLTQCIDTIFEESDDNKKLRNVLSFLHDEIGRTNSRIDKNEKLTHIDLDTKDPGKIIKVRTILEEANITPFIRMCVETRSGYHIIYNSRPVENCINHKMIYDFKNKTKIINKNVLGEDVVDYWFSITNTPYVAIPGTIQGGFKVKFCDDLFTK